MIEKPQYILTEFGTITMVSKKEEEDNFMISMKMMKRLGFYQMVNTRALQVFGVNIIKLLTLIQIVIFCIVFYMIIVNLCYFSNDLIYVENYLNLLISDILTTFKLYYLIKYSDRIWNCIKLTSVEYFSYKYHDRNILETGKKQSKYYANLNLYLWIAIGPIWIMSPLLTNESSVDVVQSNEVYHYRANIFNFMYPATDKFYNENFTVYYIVEIAILIIWIYSIVIFDYLMISICIVIIFELKTIVHSYSSFSTVHTRIIGKFSHSETKNIDALITNHFLDNRDMPVEQKEAIITHDLKVLIADHQHVMRFDINKIINDICQLYVFLL